MFPLSHPTLKGLRDANFVVPTDIQRLTLGHSIIGRDIIGSAKTGSGKTLALLIPVCNFIIFVFSCIIMLSILTNYKNINFTTNFNEFSIKYSYISDPRMSLEE